MLVTAIVAGTAFAAAGSATSPSAFRAAMNKVCATEKAKTHAAGAQIKAPADIGTHGPELVSATTAALAQFKKLGKPPASVAVPFGRFVSLQAQIVKVLGQAVAAAKSHDDTTAKNLSVGSYKSLGEKQGPQAQKIGVTACFAAAEPK